jgi:hypothetical protein
MKKASYFGTAELRSVCPPVGLTKPPPIQITIRSRFLELYIHFRADVLCNEGCQLGISPEDLREQGSQVSRTDRG